MKRGRSALIGAVTAALAAALAVMMWAPYPFSGLCLLLTIVFAALVWKIRRPAIRALFVNLAAVSGLGLALELYALVVGPSHPDPVRFEGDYEGSGYFVEHPLLGYAPDPGRAVRSVKFKGERQIYDVVYTIGGDSRRMTPDGRWPDDRCVIFFGGSFTFGEGVSDEQSMPFRVGQQITVKSQNFGFHGYGPHQMLAAIEGDLVDCQPVAVVYQALRGHVGRVLGYSSWDSNGPRYELEQGLPKRRGRFADAREQIQSQKEAAKSGPLDGSLFYRRIIGRKIRYSSADYELFGAVVEASMNLLRRRFPGATFDVILWPGQGRDPVVEAMTTELTGRNIAIHHINDVIPDHAENSDRYHIALDGHPTAAAHAAIADYVVREITPESLRISLGSSGHAVDAIQDHVDQQADTNQTQFARNQQ